MYFALLSGGEILAILIAILILFGGTRLPQLGDALGKGIRNFRKAIGGKKDEEETLEPEAPKPEKTQKEPLALPPAATPNAKQNLQEISNTTKQHSTIE